MFDSRSTEGASEHAQPQASVNPFLKRAAPIPLSPPAGLC